ncbi:phosphatase PAP2 family protein [Streptomyces sp. TR06-5]|uniref:phosphatase PAP2 family protein n=1 Tax=unclassified Streptomyces TaxID=2593676 RepID=UPI0039A0FD5F
MAGWDNPDVDLLYDVNGLAQGAPTWADQVMEYVGEYGTVLAVVLLGLCAWWSLRRRSPDRDTAAGALAGLVWAPLAAAVALLVNIPIRNLVERPRPFVDHDGLEVLVGGKSDFSFVSDHAALTMAVAVAIFMVSRTYGLLGIAVAVFAGFSRVYMGVHYPTDVIGGLALGTAVALLLAPLALWLLTPLMQAVAQSPRAGRLVWAGAEPSPGAAGGGAATAGRGPTARTTGPFGPQPDSDLAA